MSHSPKSATAHERQQIVSVRNSLLGLHKILLELERQRYERTNGRVNDTFQLLNLTINDPAFAWLRPLSALIVQIDEKLDDKDEPMTAAQAKAMRSEIRELLTPSQTGGDFQRNYHWALQESPDAVIAHSAAIRGLAPAS